MGIQKDGGNGMNNITDALKGLGYTTIDEKWYELVAEWRSWYKGSVAKFHNYRVWTGQKYVPCSRYSLGMAKKVCEDFLAEARAKGLFSDEEYKSVEKEFREQIYIL